jgi:sialic acid synthase SpsE/sugar phosphate isomerase/epimerase
MLIERDISKYIVFYEDPLLQALKKISENKSRIIFSVKENGIIEGVLTDGDLRRWLVEKKEIDLNKLVFEASNKVFMSGRIDEDPETYASRFTENIQYLPLLDHQDRLVAIALPGNEKIQIENLIIDEGSPAFIIAEIGNNHNGSLKLAKQLVDEAVQAGADCAKFQMRSMKDLYSNQGKADDPSADLGAQYTLDLLNRFQLTEEDFFKVFDYCKEKGTIPLCTPSDKVSLEALEKYGLPAYKIASADFTNHDLLHALIRTGKPLLCSTGMSTEVEVHQTIALLQEHHAQFVLLHCNSTYPTPLKDVNLEYMDHLKEIGHCSVGYSGHERGINISLAAVARGAKVLERHFTLNRNMEGNDHRVSLLPDEFALMVKGVREIEESLGNRHERKLSQGELMNREVLGKSLYAKRPLKKGEIISRNDIVVMSPGQGIPPNKIDQLAGIYSPRDMNKGDVFYISDLKPHSAGPRDFNFQRPFGIPVRYHDFQKLHAMSNLKFVEFHLSYKDMDVDLDIFFKDCSDFEFTVHCPELFANDHILDLCSLDESYRTRSIEEVQRVIQVTLKLRKYFKCTAPPLIVINVGGHSQNAPLPVSERQKLYDLALQSLSKLDQEGVELIPQTMPPFPWHFGGQRFQNLFMDATEISDFCQNNNYRVCLDISHSKLACNHYKWSFKNFIETVGPYSALFHIVDASGVDGEGLQIGEGEVDFALLGEQLDNCAPNAGFIPEIWQGHKNHGEGFWVALDRLEKWF